jgi:hypothetical protein
LAIIDNYQAKYKYELGHAIETLAKDEAKLPTGGSLRNLAEMKVRWQANEDDIKSMRGDGVNLVWSSSHVDASVRCTPWQGRLYSLNGSSGEIDDIPFVPLIEATRGTHGDGNGLLG